MLKVPHHGSRYQDLAFLIGLGARVALVSGGGGQRLRPPGAGTLDAAGRGGAEVLRTDLDGDVAVVVRDGELDAATGP